jgi:hypothetical protein
VEVDMASRAARILTSLATVSATALLLSCGGSHDSLTGPSLVAPDVGSASGLPAVDTAPADGQALGALDARSGHDKVLVCHKGKTLSVSPSAIWAHLHHGDTRGACGAPVDCPCFSSADIQTAASQCSNLNASCPATFSLGLFCAPGGSGGTVGNVGYWEAVVGQDTCSWTSWDPLTGDSVTQTLPVDDAQFQACRTAITLSSPYPASCPQ